MNLVTFGCSYTYGLSLPDCSDIKGELPPSQYAWPNVVNKILNCNSIDNKGFPGASNYLIYNKLLDYNFIENSFVVIVWTHFVRYTLYQSKKMWKNIAVTDDENKLMYNFLKTVPDYHLYKINADSVINAYYYLKYKKIPFYFAFAAKEDYECFENYTLNNKFVSSSNFFKNFLIDYGKDGSHPGIQSHKNYGKYLANEINTHFLQ